MGQAILYCWKCGCVLRAADFERKKAYRVSGQGSCSECINELVAPLSAEERNRILDGKEEAEEAGPPPSGKETATRRKTQTSRIPVVSPGTARRRVVSGKDQSVAAMWLILGAGAIIGIVAIVALTSGGGRATPQAVPAEAVATPRPPEPLPVPVADPVPPPPASVSPPENPSADRKETARKALEEVQAYIKSRPEDFEGQLKKCVEAALRVDGTEYAPRLVTLRSSIESSRRERIRLSLEEIGKEVGKLISQEQFGRALASLGEVEKRHVPNEWSEGLKKERDRVMRTAREALPPLVTKAVAAKRRGESEDLERIVERVGRWNIAELAAELSRELAKASKGEPATAEARTYRTKWHQAMAHARALDFDAAEYLLRKATGEMKEKAVAKEAAEDVATFRAVAALHKRSQERLNRWPKGRPVRLDYRPMEGPATSVEGVLLRLEDGEAELLKKGSVVKILLSELTAGCRLRLSGLEASRSEDRRLSAIYSLTTGDVAEARERSGTSEGEIPRKYRAYAEAVPSEANARKQFAVAETRFNRLETRGGAGEDYQRLLDSYPEDAFVRRIRPVLERRQKGLTEHSYAAADLKGSGSFARMDDPKVGEAWMSGADYPPTGGLDNHVEFSFTALPEKKYRAWVYAGGCCAETYQFSVQATGLKGPPSEGSREEVSVEPGSTRSTPVRAKLRFVRKEHRQHGGRKAPAKWNWIELPLSGQGTAGVKTVRIVTRQKGFSVAFVAVSAERSTAPRPMETKGQIKRALAILESAESGRTPVKPAGRILREFWLNVPGSKMPDLTGHAAFPSRPSGEEYLSKLEGPTQFAEAFGARIRGFVHPPISGLYTFWVCSDDNAEVWLSSDERPQGKRKICSLDGAAKQGDWEYQPTTKSVEIPLRAGRRYYIEVLHKEGALEDHVAVGWRLPNGTLERPIPGGRLSPPESGATARSATGGKKTFYRGINLNGPRVTIAGQSWEDGIISENVVATGKPVRKPEVVLNPVTDPDRASMLHSFVYGRPEGTRVTVSGVPAGTYEVYLYLWEDNDPETFDLFVNGSRVRAGYRSGPAGRWERVGPWTVEVEKGALEVKASRGAAANFSGIEIWRVYR